MQRDLIRLADSTYDVLVVGGGIYGAWVAREAALRGLSVALVEMADFASGTSANSLKIMHGGLRYLQHGDLRRMRISIHERRTLMQLAPHLVHPLPVLMPTYGHGVHGKDIFRLALMLNDVMSFDRNRGLDAQHCLPRGRVLSREACLQLAPGLRREHLTGGAFFYDAQVQNSERLLLACLHSAVQAGAVLANYSQVVGFMTQGDRVVGVQVQDALRGEQFALQARMVVNTAGPWVNQLLGRLPQPLPDTSGRYAKAINLITRSLGFPCAVGVHSWQDYQDPDTLINKGSRFLFITPWRGQSLIGTAYRLVNTTDEGVQGTSEDIEFFLADINRAYPLAQLEHADVSFVHAGCVPIAGIHPVTGDIQLAKHHQIRDHRQDGWSGLLSVIGVKYTTARYVAERVIDHVFAIWGQRPERSRSAQTPLHGGHIEPGIDMVQAVLQQRPYGLGEDLLRHLVSTYGSAYPEVLSYMPEDRHVETWEAVLTAEVLYAIEHEMAQKLTDVVFRRTDLGTAGHPDDGPLWHCARVMGRRCGWGQRQMQQEIDAVKAVFPVGREQHHHGNARVASTTVQ